jgi:hypothetical protein
MAADHAGCQAKLWARVLVEGRGAGAGESAGSRGGCGTLRFAFRGKKTPQDKESFSEYAQAEKSKAEYGNGSAAQTVQEHWSLTIAD